MLETKLKPQYDVELVKKNRAHFYRVEKDGHEVLLPGVTGYLSVINKPALVPWAKKIALEQVRQELLSYGPNPVVLEPDFINGIIEGAKKRPDQVKDAAADYGTRLHDYADRVIKGLPIGQIENDLQNSVLGFQDWFKSTGIGAITGDTAVASLRYGYGGKFDAIGQLRSKWGVIDFKSSNAIRSEYSLQVGAYAKAAEETYGIPIDWALIVRFGKTTPDFEQKFVKDLNHSFDAFMNAKRLKDALENDLYAD